MARKQIKETDYYGTTFSRDHPLERGRRFQDFVTLLLYIVYNVRLSVFAGADYNHNRGFGESLERVEIKLRPAVDWSDQVYIPLAHRPSGEAEWEAEDMFLEHPPLWLVIGGYARFFLLYTPVLVTLSRRQNTDGSYEYERNLWSRKGPPTNECMVLKDERCEELGRRFDPGTTDDDAIEYLKKRMREGQVGMRNLPDWFTRACRTQANGL